MAREGPLYNSVSWKKVSSRLHSEVLDALLLDVGLNMIGKKLFIPMEDKTINVTVANPVFFDTENKRLNA